MPAAEARARVVSRPMAAPPGMGVPGVRVQGTEVRMPLGSPKVPVGAPPLPLAIGQPRGPVGTPNYEQVTPQWLVALDAIRRLGIPNLTQIPLADKIKPGERVVVRDQRAIRTASHELAHAKAIEMQGGAVLHISVEPDATSWGRTMGTGMTKEAFQVAAMASVVGGHDGTSMDEFQAHALSSQGGLPVESAAAIARSILSKVDPQVEQRAAELLAYFGHADGKTYTQIYERAALDVFLEDVVEKRIGWDVFREAMVQLEDHAKRVDDYAAIPGDKPEDRVEVIDGIDDRTRFIRIEQGVKVQEISRCSLCGQQQGHAPDCKAITPREVSGENVVPTPLRRSVRARSLVD